MKMVKRYPTHTGYHPKLGQLVVGVPVVVSEEKAELYAAIMKVNKSDAVKVAPDTGTIDLTDGVSDAEANLAGRTLAAKRKQSQKKDGK